jgi:hypothetical protein
MYVVPLKYELKLFRFKLNLLKLELFNFINIIFLLLISYCLFKEIFIAGFILFIYINIYLYKILYNYFKNLENGLLINVLLICLIYLYLQSIVSINNSINKNDIDIIETSF